MLYSKLPVHKVYKPFGLMLLAECIEKAGFKCDILDLMTCKPSKKENMILKMANKYSIIGFSFSAIGYLEALKMAKLCKELNPDCKIVFGGPHASFLYEEILKNYKFVDFIVVGEGEESIVDLLTEGRNQ